MTEEAVAGGHKGDSEGGEETKRVKEKDTETEGEKSTTTSEERFRSIQSQSSKL